MPAAASAVPMIAMPMPASPQKISSIADRQRQPGRIGIMALSEEVDPVQPDLRAASCTTGQGNSSRSSHS